MNSFSKALLIICCAAMVYTASMLGTVAYFTASVTVENTFTVGQVSLDLTDAADKEAAQAYSIIPQTNQYSYKLIPGNKYSKHPTVTVLKGSEQAYVRMIVTMNKAEALNNIFEDFQYDTLLQGIGTGWTCTGMSVVDGVVQFEFRFDGVVSAKESDVALPALIQSIVIPGAAMDNAALEALGELEIRFIAQAIQAEGFADADAAWTAFDEQHQQQN